MQNNIEVLKQYIINKDFEKAINIINNSHFDLYLYDNVRILFILSINNNFNYLFDKYLNHFKSNPEYNYLISYGISRSIESNNIYSFKNLVNNSNFNDEEISKHILTLSSFFYSDIYVNMLNILIKKYSSFNLTSLTALSMSINSKNHYIYNTIIKHMKNINEVNENWIEENIQHIEDQKNIKKIIKIKTF